jgi:hypothetical protein
MKSYSIMIDGDKSEDNSDLVYQIAIMPSGINASAMATRNYTSKEAFIADLQRYFGFTERAIDQFFSKYDHHQAIEHQLSDEDAAYFGWV